MQDEPYSFGIYNWRGEVLGTVLIDAEDADNVMACEWTINKAGYVRRRGEPTNLARSLHRFVMGAHTFDGTHVVDHINRNKLDNRKSNLRLITWGENRQNHPVDRGRNKSSRYRGVFWNKQRGMWTATGRHYHLGHFVIEEEAAACSRAWRTENLPYAET